MELPLTKLRNGESGVITSIRIVGSEHRGRRHHWHRGGPTRYTTFMRRLTDMGLTPGVTLTVVKSAPFLGPIEITVRGSRLALGRGMAKRIFVEVER
jgi:Fe2+ transport system protein FeoA